MAWLCRHYLEPDFSPGQFDPRTQSWMFLMDIVALAPAAGVIAYAWRRPEVRDSYLVSTKWWLPLCLMIGFVAGAGFHAMDVSAYAHIPGAITSYTKIQHDFLAYPVLFGSLVYGGIPLLRSGRVTLPWVDWQVWAPKFVPEVRTEAIIVLVLVVGLWAIIGGVLHDMRPGVLKPENLHPPHDPSQ